MSPSEGGRSRRRGRGAMPCDGVHNDSHYLTGIEPGEGHLEHLSQLTNSIAPFSLPAPPPPFPDLGGMDGKTFQIPWQMFPLPLRRGLLFFLRNLPDFAAILVSSYSSHARPTVQVRTNPAR